MFESYNDNGKLQYSTQTSAFTLIGSGEINAQDVYFVPGTGFLHDPDDTYIANREYVGTYSLENMDAPAGTDLLVWNSPQAYGTIYLYKNKIIYQTQPCEQLISGIDRTNEVEHVGNWWAYKSMRNVTSSSTVGLQLMNADGTLAWDSNYKPLLVTSSVTYNPATDFSAGVTLTNSPMGILFPIGFVNTRRSNMNYKLGAKGLHIKEFAVEPVTAADVIPSSTFKFIGVV